MKLLIMQFSTPPVTSSVPKLMMSYDKFNVNVTSIGFVSPVPLSKSE